jgi:hypothetical protein
MAARGGIRRSLAVDIPSNHHQLGPLYRGLDNFSSWTRPTTGTVMRTEPYN